jgi:hypothetical protein
VEHVLAVELVNSGPGVVELKGLAATHVGSEVQVEKVLVEESEVVVGIEDDIVFSSGIIDRVPRNLGETTLGVESVGA